MVATVNSIRPSVKTHPVIRRLEAVTPLNDGDRAALGALLENQMVVVPKADILMEGDSCPYVSVVLKGWLMRYRLLDDGRRQILDFLVPGDFFGLQTTMIGAAAQSTQPLTPCTIARFRPEALFKLVREHSPLGHAILCSIMSEKAVLAESILRVGRLSAAERLANLLVELQERLMRVGLATELGYELPVTQEILADALGLSIVHVNRTLRRLKERNLIAVDHLRQRLIIKNSTGLAELAQFDGCPEARRLA